MAEPVSDSALDQLFRRARSYSKFQDKPVSDDQLRAIWELTKWGPTAANLSPLRVVWCRSEDSKATLSKLADEPNVEKVRNAPVVAILGMDMQFYEHWQLLMPYRDISGWFRGNETLISDTALRNSSLQGGYFMLAVRALGLDAGPMSGFNHTGVDQAFFKDTSVKSNFICALGYGEETSLFDRLPRGDFEAFTTTV